MANKILNIKYFSGNALIYIIGGVITAGGNIMLAPVYLRVLSGEDYGMWSKFNLLVQIFQPIMCWGLLASMSRIIVDLTEENRKQFIAAALTIATLFNTIIIVAVYLLVKLKFAEELIDISLLKLLPYALIVTATSAYPNILMGVYIADGSAIKYRGLGLIGFALQATFLGLFAYNTEMLYIDAIVALLLASLLYSVWSIYILVKKSKWAIKIKECKLIISYGLPVVFYSIIGQLTDFVIRYMLMKKVDVVEFGVFGAITIYASIVAMFSSAINLAWVPIYFRNGSIVNSTDLYAKYCDIFIAFNAIIAAFLIIFSNDLISIYSNNKIAVDISIAGKLIVTAWLNSAVWMCLVNPIFYAKRTRLVFLIVLLAFLATLPIIYYFATSNSTYGAVFSLLFNAVALCLIALLILNKINGPKINIFKILFILILLLLISNPLIYMYSENTEWLIRILGKLVILGLAIMVISVMTIQSIMYFIKNFNGINEINEINEIKVRGTK